jgi:hypothetical protein
LLPGPALRRIPSPRIKWRWVAGSWHVEPGGAAKRRRRARGVSGGAANTHLDDA